MTEYVITEVSPHQWLVFADRRCIASCADEVGAEKAMNEHSARGLQSPEPNVAPLIPCSQQEPARQFSDAPTLQRCAEP
jgi:hypothetical protein